MDHKIPAAGGSGSPWSTLAAALLIAAAAPTAAHEFWLVPETFEPSVGARVGIRVFVGDGLDRGRPYPRNPDHIRHFQAVTGTVEPVAGSPGADPAGELVAGEPGLLAVVYRSHPSTLTLGADDFESYLRQEGLEHVSRLRAGSSETGKPGREAFSRCAKSLLRVGGGEPDGWDRTIGLDLEIVPQRSPFDLEAGGTLPIVVLWRQEPLAGALVRAFVQGHPAHTFETRTGADGTADLELDPAGVWMLSVVHMEAADSGSDVDWVSTWSSLTFETRRANEERGRP